MEQEQHTPEIERPPEPEPRIYVASLADYNAGHLHGRWINASQLIDDIHQEVAEMLEQSTELVAEEFAIHDYEGFGPLQLSEYESLDTVARIAEGITEHGLAFAHWASLVGTSEDDLNSFEDHYLGHWASMTAYTEELIADFGVEAELDQLSLPFKECIRIDVDALARDLEIEHLSANDDTGVYLWSLS